MLIQGYTESAQIQTRSLPQLLDQHHTLGEPSRWSPAQHVQDQSRHLSLQAELSVLLLSARASISPRNIKGVSCTHRRL